jgi:hypothetical protein
MQIATQHSKTVGKRAGISMKERLLLNGIALDSADVAPWDIELSAAVETNFAHAGLSIWNRATVSARVAAQPIAIELLDQTRIGLSNTLIQDVSKCAHDFILRRRETDVCGEPDLLRRAMLPEPIIRL